MENLGCEIAEENGTVNGAADQASCSNAGNEAAIRSAEEEEDEDEDEEEEEEEELRMKKLGDLIGPENLKALLDADGGGRRNAAYQNHPNWRRRRRRRRKRKVKDSNSDESHDQIQAEQQPDHLPLETAKEEKQQEESRNGVNAIGENNVVPRELVDTVRDDKQQEKSNNGVVESGEDNVVLRKLLRRPRYFDLPMEDGSEESCPLCGQDGHAARRCVLQNQKKPCFLCGSSEHAWKHCDKSLYKGEGCHSEEKGELSSVICLKCGETGHDMLSCKSDYAPDDLKEIECYVCNKVGHLCCCEFSDNSGLLLEVTCYNCGEPGHSGSGCTNEPLAKNRKPRFRSWSRRKRFKVS